MNVVSIDKLWSEIETLTTALQFHAEKRDWDKLLAVHTQRQNLIVRLFRVNKDQYDLKTRLLKLLSKEKDLLSVCNDEKRAVADEIMSLRKNRQAAQSYSQT